MKLPKWHWKNQSEEKQKIALLKMSKGWKNLEKCPFKKMGENRNCLICGKIFYVKRAHISKGKGKYCSPQCCGIAKKSILENKHSRWQGEKPTYVAVHHWIRKHKIKTGICCHCKKLKKTQWANVSKKYMRSTNDFIELCASCHKKYDMGG